MPKHSPGCRAHLPALGARWPITTNATVQTLYGPWTLLRDNKTTPGTRTDSQGRWTAIPNASMLPAGPTSMGGTCGELDEDEGLTEHCAGCYAANLERAYPSLSAAAARNLRTLTTAHLAAGVDGAADVVTAGVELSAGAQYRAGVASPIFRHHADGEILADWHADAIRMAAERTSDVSHWLYSRKPSLARRLVGIPNLAVLLSADRANIELMLGATRELGLPIAYLSDATPEDDANIERIVDVTGRRAISCPATGAWKHDGRGPAHVVGVTGRRADMGPDARVGAGACAACTKCVSPAGPSIVFDRHGGAPKRTAHEVFVSLRSRA